MSKHLHIVPSVPPDFNGLGDYCYQLWKHWPSPRPEWLVATARMPDGAQAAWPEIQHWPFECKSQDLTRVLDAAKPDKVVLHYVGYGYAQRGAPNWLQRALKQWKSESGGKLVVMFHELYATGPPWKSEFWFCLSQRSITKNIVTLTDA